jgi:DNA (cytosine-5)-methyltransferase 1
VSLILSLFPGIGLLDMAFESEGFCVVRGPDLLWGGRIETFHPPAGRFDGVIGGPPCQQHSTASAIRGTEAEDLIPEFLRVVREAEPAWVVMENVLKTVRHPAVPADWFPALLRDWDCGGLTARRRVFFSWPFAILSPSRAPGDASHSVMATSWKRGSSKSQYVKDKGFLPGDLPIEEYARLQGAEEIGQRLVAAHSSKAFAVHVLGNGVPLAMGRAVARAVKEAISFTPPDPGNREATRGEKERNE